MLFSNTHRRDMDPSQFSESHFAYLDRSGRAVIGRIRDVLEDWYTRYPDNHGELKQRIQSNDDANFMSAFFELYIHEILLRLGYSPVPHPPLPTGSTRHPDFLVHNDNGQDFYVETVLATGQSETGAARQALKNQVLDIINRMHSPNFFIDVEVIGSPNTPPRASQWKKSLSVWVASLDPDEITSLYEHSGYKSIPECKFHHDGCTIVCRAFPKRPKSRGQPDVRPIGLLHGNWQMDNSSQAIRNAVIRKAHYYGELDMPYIIAINAVIPFADDDSFITALFGTEQIVISWDAKSDHLSETIRDQDGLWSLSNGPKYSIVSGILAVKWLKPSTVSNQNLVVFRNPWAIRPYSEPITRLSQRVVENGYLVLKEGVHPRNLLGLPEEWPEHLLSEE